MNIFKITLNYDDGTSEDRTLDVGCSIEELRDILMQTVPGIESVDIQAPERWREIEVSYLVEMIDELEEAIDTCVMLKFVLTIIAPYILLCVLIAFKPTHSLLC